MKKEILKAIEEILEGLTYLGYASSTFDAVNQSILALLVVTTGTDAYAEFSKTTIGETTVVRSLRFLGPFLECVSALMLLRSEITYPDAPESVLLKQIDFAVFSMAIAVKIIFSKKLSLAQSAIVSGLISVGFQSVRSYQSIPKTSAAIIGFFSSVRGIINLFALADPEPQFKK